MPVKCPQCGRMTNDARHVCMYCGAALGERVPCSGCKRPLIPGTPKCIYCGAVQPGAGAVRVGDNPPAIVQVHVADPSQTGDDLVKDIERRIDAMRQGTAVRYAPQEMGMLATMISNQVAELFQNGQVEDALALLDQALLREPETARLHFLRGLVLNHLRRFEEALAAFDQALEHDPSDSQYWFRKADVLDNLGRTEEALGFYDQALVLNPGFVDAWIDRGRALEVLGRNESALASYAKALRLHPNNAIAWNNRGNCLLHMDRPADAEQAFRRALQCDPSRSAVWINCGLALTRQQRPRSEVVACYRKALEVDPAGLEDAHRRAWVLSKNERYEDALPLWEALHEFLPDDPMIALKCREAQVIVEQGGRSRAEVAADDARAAGRGHAPEERFAELMEKGRGYEAAREGDLALGQYRAALEIRPEDEAALCGAARVTQRTSAPAEALEAWDRVLKYHAGCVQAHAGRAEALVEMRRYADALSAARRARELDPRHAPAWVSEGRALAGLDQTAEGAKALRQGLTLDPTLGRGWLELGEVAARLGLWVAAVDAFRRFLKIGEPAGFVTGVRERSLPRAERLARLVQEGKGWDGPTWAERGRALAAEDAEGAELCLRAALQGAPERLEWLLERGALLARLARHTEAVACADAILKRTPDHLEALTFKGLTLFQQGQQAVGAKNYGGGGPEPVPESAPILTQAAACLERAVALGADPDLRQTAGMALFMAGSPQAAQQTLEQAPPMADGGRLVVSDGGADETPYERACALLDRGELEAAAKAFLQVVRAEPTHHQAWNLLGLCLTRLGRGADALKALDHGVARCPENAALWSNRANCLSDLGCDAEALESAERALALDPNLAPAQGNRGRALAQLGRLEEALAAFEAARRLQPQDATHAANVALTIARLGRLAEALPIAEQALAINPNHPLARQVWQAIRNDLEGRG